MSGIVGAVAQEQNQPQTTFEALDTLVQSMIGAKLFTIMEVDHERGMAWRSYSNMPDAYPISGEKPHEPSKWSDIVERQGKSFVANSIEEIADVFSDFELIQSLGCESCLNIPIFINGSLRGTLNCLHAAGHYTPERVAASEQLKQPGLIALLMAQACKD